jgi:steroid delta-isomerase-like uncharacterized protein
MTSDRSDNLKQIAQDFIDAFNAGDWARFRAPLTPDLSYEETGTGRRVDDPDTYVQLCQGWKQAFPDVKGTIRNVVGAGNTVVQEILWEGTQDGELPTPNGTLPPSGRRIMTPAVLWYVFENEQMREIHHHLDVMGMMQQLGVMP